MDDIKWPKRLNALDLSRGIASLGVVLWHWEQFSYSGISSPNDFDRACLPWYSTFRIFYDYGGLGVDYFFILSGFIFFWLYRPSIEDGSTTFRNFWVQRISRLYPLHFTTLVIVALLQMVYLAKQGSVFVYPKNDLYHFCLNLVFASKWGFEEGMSFNGPVWSVSIEILLYFIFFLIAIVRMGQLVSCFTVSVLSFVLSLFSHYTFFSAVSVFFLGGGVFHVTRLVPDGARKIKGTIYVITMLSWILTVVNLYIIDLTTMIPISNLSKIIQMGFSSYVLFPLTVFSLARIEIDRGIGFLKSVSWIGDITYSSYLLHFPLQLIFGLAVGYGILSSDFYTRPVYLAIFFAILIPLSHLTFSHFERPVQNMIRNKFRTVIKVQTVGPHDGNSKSTSDFN